MSAEQVGAVNASSFSEVHSSVRRNGFKKGTTSNFGGFPIETFVDTEDDDAYTRNRTGLIRVVTALHLAIFPERDPLVSAQRMFNGMTHSRTALMLVGEPSQARGHWIGYGLFRGMSFDDQDAREDTEPEEVVYSSRGLMKGFENRGIGTHLLAESLRLFKPHWLVLMTQNEASVRTVQKLQEAGFVKQHYPFGEPLGEVTYDTNEEAQGIWLAVHNEVKISKTSRVYLDTGLVEGELQEIGMNRAADPINNPETRRIHNQMVHKWEMNRERGDVFYVTAEIDPDALNETV